MESITPSVSNLDLEKADENYTPRSSEFATIDESKVSNNKQLKSKVSNNKQLALINENNFNNEGIRHFVHEVKNKIKNIE